LPRGDCSAFDIAASRKTLARLVRPFDRPFGGRESSAAAMARNEIAEL